MAIDVNKAIYGRKYQIIENEASDLHAHRNHERVTNSTCDESMDSKKRVFQERSHLYSESYFNFIQID
jgi:hypothetical protein